MIARTAKRLDQEHDLLYFARLEFIDVPVNCGKFAMSFREIAVVGFRGGGDLTINSVDCIQNILF
jgi:hypothetical protein